MDLKCRLFSQKLKELLEKNNMTQTQLAKRLGGKKSLVSKWINGQSFPTSDSILQISLIFNENLFEDFGGIGAMTLNQMGLYYKWSRQDIQLLDWLIRYPEEDVRQRCLEKIENILTEEISCDRISEDSIALQKTDTSAREAFGEHLQILLKSRGLSQHDLARLLGCPDNASMVNNWVKGLRLPDDYYMFELSEFFQTDLFVIAGKEMTFDQLASFSKWSDEDCEVLLRLIRFDDINVRRTAVDAVREVRGSLP